MPIENEILGGIHRAASAPTRTLPRRRGREASIASGGGFRLENRRGNSALLLALRHFLELFLELVEALVQILDGAVVARGGRGAGRGGLRRRRDRALRHAGHRAAREGREHLHGLFEQRQVLLAHFLERAEREQAAERVLKVLAHLFLVAGETRHRLFEIARHDELHRIAVQRDELAQERDRQKILSLALFLDDDLG